MRLMQSGVRKVPNHGPGKPPYMLLSPVLAQLSHYKLGFACPGCMEVHEITFRPFGERTGWKWDGNREKPTISPSILVEGIKCELDEHWNWTGEWVLGPDGKAIQQRCHSFVEDGRILFQTDCTHELAGQTVDMIPFPEGYS